LAGQCSERWPSFFEPMNVLKIVIWGGAVVAAFLVLLLLMSPDPNRQVNAADIEKPMFQSKQETAPIIGQHQNDAEQPGPNSFSARGADIHVPAPTMVAEANSETEVAAQKAPRTRIVPDQPAAAPLSSQASVEANQAQPVEVHLPAALLPLPDNRNWSADDAAAVAALAKDFNDSVMKSANSAQSPADPTYLRAWMTAEWLANERYRSYFGWEAFNALRNAGN